jgi:hypothetical protein
MGKMGIEKLAKSETIETGISVVAGRGAKFTLRREHDLTGFQSYVVENLVRKEQLRVPRFLFEVFRATLRSFVTNKDVTEDTVEFKGKIKFRMEVVSGVISVKAIDTSEGASGQLLLSIDGAKAVSELFYDSRIQHGSDVLGRILAYHKLFKFTFAEGSESLNSGLSLRMDVLSQVENYVPPVGRRSGSENKLLAMVQAGQNASKSNIKSEDQAKELKSFKSRLGERQVDKEWSVDYQALFGAGEQKSADRQPKVNAGENSSKSGRAKHVWPLPIMSAEVRQMMGKTLRCEFSTEDIQEMRDTFLSGIDTEYFLGFEKIDVIFRSSSGQLKTFRFPLYYTPVKLLESGRQILISAAEGSRIYLNHLALATLIESFSDEANTEAAVDQFFVTLLSQKVEFDGRLGRIYLSRELPVADEVFQRTREIFLGHPGENGKGGLFSALNIVGAECDTESVSVYKSSKVTGALQKALELDLEMMQDLADRSPEKFSKTLPGRFLSTSHKDVTKSGKPFCDRPYTPFYRPHSTRLLMDKLNNHDVVLLEGPPGTGKTFTIMNLLIHAVCSGQRVLIVSDQEAALHALSEKLEEYLNAGDRGLASDAVALWKRGVQMVDRLSGGHSDLSLWCRTVEECLGLVSAKELRGSAFSLQVNPRDIERIDAKIEKVKAVIGRVMDSRIGPKTDLSSRVSPKRGHATTVSDIEAFVDFLKFMGGRSETTKSSREARFIAREFVIGREYLSALQDPDLYEIFVIPDRPDPEQLKYLPHAISVVKSVQKAKPRSLEDLQKIIGSPADSRLNRHLFQIWAKYFPPGEAGISHAIRTVKSLVQHPAKAHLIKLSALFSSQLKLINSRDSFGKGVWRQFQIIHEALGPNYQGAVPLSLEVCRFATTSSFTFGHPVDKMPSVQELLEELQELDRKRAKLVKHLFISKLADIVTAAQASKQGQSNALTSISSMLHSLKGQETLEGASGAWRELQEKLVDVFPIWLVRKQAVSFLFPCKAKMFDLVIVDEATQCRVDDALPLMLRARKFMVVGDDKQTVLQKDSVIDDYLFKEFNLDEHLRTTQARGIKGGGSHIFGLVKGIKEASVMLDEHYRCPPDIIEYSNRYVYNSELKVMQWQRAGVGPAVSIDWSERNCPSSERAESGSFKGIETDMVDRYLDWVAQKIKDIEKSGTRINVETDVALVYFLLKNEPYIKSKKSEWLARVDRGSDVLDGAGAALQGKERPYIFYLWDMSRSNMMAFRQGDDPDKRKGELNVLMSRPKKRAYHYLHKNFDELDHEKASISDFLWKAWKRQEEGEKKQEFIERKKPPGPEYFPWRRSSGHLMKAILDQVLSRNAESLGRTITQTGVVVGDPRFKMDLVLGRKGSKDPSIGIVDLCGFDWHESCADDIVDYYFQLTRAEPKVRPVFLFIHELADRRSRGFVRLHHMLSGIMK